MRIQDWASLVAVGAAILAVAAAVGGSLPWAAGWTALAIGAGAAARTWSLKYPGPMPHLVRWVLLLPRGPNGPAQLERVLRPRSGERILEIGPGVGVHALPIASSLLPDGVLEVLDVQQKMLDDLKRRAEKAGITNIVARQGDAQKLPYSDRAFDAAYLVGVLGEIPDEAAALRELQRILKPEGRLVIGEVLLDPDYVSPSTLRRKAQEAGFVFERKVGPAVAYFALFRPNALAT